MASRDFYLAEFLPYRLAVLSARTSGLLEAIYANAYGLSTPEWRVMVHVARCEKVSVREIHRCVNLEKPRVSRAVAKLQGNGLLEKAPSALDQRLVEIVLTDKGRAVLDGIIPQALEIEARLLSGFSPEEQRLLVEMMERLHARIDAFPDAPRRSEMDRERPEPPAAPRPSSRSDRAKAVQPSARSPGRSVEE